MCIATLFTMYIVCVCVCVCLFVCLFVCLCVCVRVVSGIGYESLLEAVRIPDLTLLYGFFSRFKNGLPLMSKAFANYIKVCVYIYTTLIIKSHLNAVEPLLYQKTSRNTTLSSVYLTTC